MEFVKFFIKIGILFYNLFICL